CPRNSKPNDECRISNTEFVIRYSKFVIWQSLELRSFVLAQNHSAMGRRGKTMKFIFILLFAGLSFAQTATPTPTPTIRETVTVSADAEQPIEQVSKTVNV